MRARTPQSHKVNRFSLSFLLITLIGIGSIFTASCKEDGGDDLTAMALLGLAGSGSGGGNTCTLPWLGGDGSNCELSLSGTVTTYAGTGSTGSADGTGTAASFNLPYGITTDGTNLYVADTTNSLIRKIE